MLLCLKGDFNLADSKKKGIQSFFYDFKRFTPLLSNLVSKDFKIKYRRSFLGIAWSVLNPLLTMLVLTKVFTILLRVGNAEDFSTYYIIGSSLWAFFSEATSNSLSSVIGAASLIKKVYIPKYIFPVEKCLFSLVNFLFSLIAVLLVIIVRGITLGTNFLSFYSLLFPIPVIYCFIFVCGMSLFLSAVTVYFRDVAHLYGVLLTMWIYLTPILYPISLIRDSGHKFVYLVIRLNPMTHYVEAFRDVLMRHTFPSLRENLICISFSLVTFVFGALVFKKAQKKFILHI